MNGKLFDLPLLIAAILVPNSSIAKGQGGKSGLFLEKIGEVGDFFETEGISDLGDIPVGLAQKDLGFLEDAAGDQTRGSLTGVFLQYFVQVVDVDGKAVGIVPGGPQAESLAGGLDGKLAFEELDEK